MNYRYRECEKCIIKKKSMDEYRGGANMHCVHCENRPDTEEEKEIGQKLFFSKKFKEIHDAYKDQFDILSIALIDDLVFGIEKNEAYADEEQFHFLMIVKPSIEELILQENNNNGRFLDTKMLNLGDSIVLIRSIHSFRDDLTAGTAIALRYLQAIKNDSFVSYYRNNELKEGKDEALCYMKLLTLAGTRVINKVEMIKKWDLMISDRLQLINALDLTISYNILANDQLELYSSDKEVYNLLCNNNAPNDHIILYNQEIERLKVALEHVKDNNTYKKEIFNYIISLAYDIKPVDLTEFFTIFSERTK